MNARRFSALLLAAAVLVPRATAGQEAAPSAAAAALVVGDTVPGFDAVGLDGATHQVRFPKGSKTILLFMLAGCPACQKMVPEWNRMYARKPKDLTVYAVLLNQEPPGYFMATPVSFPILRSPGGDFAKTFKLSHVPVTLRVAAGGRVEDVGVGPIDALRLGEIFRP